MAPKGEIQRFTLDINKNFYSSIPDKYRGIDWTGLQCLNAKRLKYF